MALNEGEDSEDVDAPPFYEEEIEEAGSDEYVSVVQAPRPNRRSTENLWLVSYADFMTILMIFFLAMYGYTYLAKASLLKQQEKVMKFEEFTLQMNTMKAKFGDQMKVQEDLDKITIQLGEQILFPSGSAQVSATAKATLEEMSNSIKLMEGDVIVQGFTDNRPVAGGRFVSNWELSAARSFSVIEVLTESGVPKERLAAWGFGENRPISSNATVEGRGQNRRIEVVVLKKKEGV